MLLNIKDFWFDSVTALALLPVFGDARAARAVRGWKWGRTMSVEEIEQRLEGLRIEHRDLDCAIIALSEAVLADQLQLARLKKRKLRLRDEISVLESSLIPDDIA